MCDIEQASRESKSDTWVGTRGVSGRNAAPEIPLKWVVEGTCGVEALRSRAVVEDGEAIKATSSMTDILVPDPRDEPWNWNFDLCGRSQCGCDRENCEG